MSKLTKEEALKHIDELTKFVESCDKKEYIPKVGETVICHGLIGGSNIYRYGNEDGDIAVVLMVNYEYEGALLYNPRWNDECKWYAYFSQIEPFDIEKYK